LGDIRADAMIILKLIRTSFSCYYSPDTCNSRHLGEKTTGFSSLHKLIPADTLKANIVIFKTGYNGKSQCLKPAVGKGRAHNPIIVGNDEVIIIIKDKKKRSEEIKKTKNQKERKDTWREQCKNIRKMMGNCNLCN
jgi:hypothetical protein